MHKFNRIKYLGFTLIALLLFSCNNSEISDDTKTETSLVEKKEIKKNKIIPDLLVSMIKSTDYYFDIIIFTEIKTQIFKILRDSVIDSDGGIYTQFFFTDLNNDSKDELICVFAKDGSGSIGIFNKLDKNWECLYFEDYYSRWDFRDDISIIDTLNEKLVSIKEVVTTGSGVFKEVTHFLKFIDGEILDVITLINSNYVVGWGAIALNFETSSKYHFEKNAKGKNDLIVNYKYTYYPSASFGAGLNNDDCHPEYPLIKANKTLSYVWDSVENSYKPNFENSGLSAAKLKALDIIQFNDSLMIYAFKDEIDSTIKNGTKVEARLLRHYLSMKKNLVSTQ